MKVRMTFDLSDEERLALSMHFGRKTKATRVHVAQFIAGLMERELGAMARERRRRLANPDPDQMKIPEMRDAFDPVDESVPQVATA